MRAAGSSGYEYEAGLRVRAEGLGLRWRDLVQLRELQLDRNHLREIPDQLFTLENLRVRLSAISTLEN